MEGIERAIAMEKRAEGQYRDLAGKAVNPGLRSVFLLLAEEEARHQDFYKARAEGADVKMKDSELISAVKKVFLKIRESKDISGTGIAEVEFYKKALEFEKEHYDFYRVKAEDARNEEERKLFLKIAGEEKRHALVLENVVQFVSRPETWLEDAEWYHLDEY